MLTQERLKEVLAYDPETGVATWRVKRGRSHGRARAGYIGPDGYWLIMVDGKSYLLHRLARFYMTGEWPKADSDHINLDRADNRWANLREADRSHNNANSHVRSRSQTGFKGVRPHRNRFVAQITTGKGGVRYLGIRDTPEEAHALYVKAAQERFGEFARAE